MADLDPCPQCGAYGSGELEMYGQDHGWMLAGKCTQCGKALSFGFTTIEGPYDLKGTPFELGPGPSELLTPERLEAELARLRPHIAPEPEVLQPAAWQASWKALCRATVSANERLKLGADADLERERDALRVLVKRYQDDGDRVYRLEHPLPRGKLGPDELRAHASWLRNGRQGSGRLVLEKVELIDMQIGTQHLTGAKLADVVLSGANLRSSTLDDMTFSRVTAVGTTFTMASLRRAYIGQGTYTQAHLELTNLDDIVIDGADFAGALFDRAIWKGARVTDTRLANAYFGNSRLDAAELTGCDLRGATFAPRDRFPLPTTRGTTFTGCDLRDTDWHGRDLSGASFVDCKLEGAKGTPSATTELVVTGGDISLDELLTRRGWTRV